MKWLWKNCRNGWKHHTLTQTTWQWLCVCARVRKHFARKMHLAKRQSEEWSNENDKINRRWVKWWPLMRNENHFDVAFILEPDRQNAKCFSSSTRNESENETGKKVSCQWIPFENLVLYVMMLIRQVKYCTWYEWFTNGPRSHLFLSLLCRRQQLFDTATSWKNRNEWTTIEIVHRHSHLEWFGMR